MAVPGGDACGWRMTNVNVKMSSSSLLSLIRKLGTPSVLGSGSCSAAWSAEESRAELVDKTDLDEFYRGCIARYSGSGE